MSIDGNVSTADGAEQSDCAGNLPRNTAALLSKCLQEALHLTALAAPAIAAEHNRDAAEGDCLPVAERLARDLCNGFIELRQKPDIQNWRHLEPYRFTERVVTTVESVQPGPWRERWSGIRVKLAQLPRPDSEASGNWFSQILDRHDWLDPLGTLRRQIDVIADGQIEYLKEPRPRDETALRAAAGAIRERHDIWRRKLFTVWTELARDLQQAGKPAKEVHELWNGVVRPLNEIMGINRLRNPLPAVAYWHGEEPMDAETLDAARRESVRESRESMAEERIEPLRVQAMQAADVLETAWRPLCRRLPATPADRQFLADLSHTATEAVQNSRAHELVTRLLAAFADAAGSLYSFDDASYTLSDDFILENQFTRDAWQALKDVLKDQRARELAPEPPPGVVDPPWEFRSVAAALAWIKAVEDWARTFLAKLDALQEQQQPPGPMPTPASSFAELAERALSWRRVLLENRDASDAERLSRLPPFKLLWEDMHSLDVRGFPDFPGEPATVVQALDMLRSVVSLCRTTHEWPKAVNDEMDEALRANPSPDQPAAFADLPSADRCRPGKSGGRPTSSRTSSKPGRVGGENFGPPAMPTPGRC